MHHFGTSDLPSMLADFGVPVVWGSVTGNGIVDEADHELYTGGNVVFTGKERTLTLEADRFLGLAENATITVDGSSFRVIQAHQTGDGALLQVLLMPS
jgi:hypothetical protein